MRFSFLALTPIKLIRPRRTLPGLLSKLLEGLADEYGPGKSSMHPKRLAAALSTGAMPNDDGRLFQQAFQLRLSLVDRYILKIFAVEPEKIDGAELVVICDYGSSFKSEKKTRLNRIVENFI